MGSLTINNEASDVIQGGQVTLTTMFETYVNSGYIAPAADVTIGIAASASVGGGSGTPVPTTSNGLTSVDSMHWTYVFACPADTVPGDYLVTWTGVVNGTTQVQLQGLTVAAIPTSLPAPGVYATYAQYQAQTGDMATPQSIVEVELRIASETIDHATIGAVYATTPNGVPSDAETIDVFMRATCAQAAFQVADGDRTGVKRQYTSTSMGGVALSRAAGMTAMPFPPLAPRAAQILHTAGVLSVAPLIDW